jgi:hypothetical protein
MFIREGHVGPLGLDIDSHVWGVPQRSLWQVLEGYFDDVRVDTL